MREIIAGVDEVGRGSLVGPVYAAAVILNKEINRKILKDSKKLNKIQRETLAKYIKKNSVWALGSASLKEIEKINILNASLLSMKRAIKKLKFKPKKVLMVTECSMSDNVQVDNPNVKFIRPCNLCPHMKRITLPKILDCLKNETNEILMSDETIEKARKSVERMAEIGR